MNAMPRHFVFVRLPPDRFALGFDPFAGTEHHHRAIEHPQAAFHLGREIDVPRRIEQIDRHVFPRKRDAGGVNGDAAFLLFGIAIRLRRSLVDFAHAMLRAGQKQHPLGDGCLAGIDVGDDADVAEFFQIASHMDW